MTTSRRPAPATRVMAASGSGAVRDEDGHQREVGSHHQVLEHENRQNRRGFAVTQPSQVFQYLAITLRKRCR